MQRGAYKSILYHNKGDVYMIAPTQGVDTSIDKEVRRIEQRLNNRSDIRNYIQHCPYEIISTTFAGNKLYKVIAKNDTYKRNILLGYKGVYDKPIYASTYKICKLVCDMLNYGALLRGMNWSHAMRHDEEFLPVLERMKPIITARAGVARSVYSGNRSRFQLATNIEAMARGILKDYGDRKRK